VGGKEVYNGDRLLSVGQEKDVHNGDSLPSVCGNNRTGKAHNPAAESTFAQGHLVRSEEHTSELQSR